MIEESEIKQIKELVEEFLQKMTVEVFSVSINSPVTNEEPKVIEGSQDAGQNAAKTLKDVINIEATVQEPQILIGQQGQTLLELQRLVRIILNKKFHKDFYVNLDINEYKKKKIEYLKDLATSSADQVSKTKEKKVLAPMPAYERRIIHAELAQRQDVITQSQGEGEERSIVISPK